MPTTVHLSKAERRDAKAAAVLERRNGNTKVSWTGLLRDVGLVGIRRILTEAGRTPASATRSGNV